MRYKRIKRRTATCLVIKSELDELKRLAKIGSAATKLIEEEIVMYDVRSYGDCDYEKIRTVEDLLKWEEKFNKYV